MSEQGAAGARSVVAEIEIDAPIDAVWKALNDAEELTRWFPLDAGVNPDGSIWMSWGGDFRFEGRPEIVDPPRRLRSTGGPGGMATDITLETRGGKTFVRLVQSGFGPGAEWDSELDGTNRGWHFQLLGLKHYLEVHRGTPRRVAWARRMISIPRAEAWKRLMSAQGLLREGGVENLRVGSRYRFVSADGDALEGVVHFLNAPMDFGGTVENLNRALLRIQLDDLPMRGYKDVNLWLSTYGIPQADVDALRGRWMALLEKLFPAA